MQGRYLNQAKTAYCQICTSSIFIINYRLILSHPTCVAETQGLGERSSYTDYDMVWTIRGSAAGMGKTSSLSQNAHPDSGKQLASCKMVTEGSFPKVNNLNTELNPICYLLALLAHHFLHVSRIRVKSLTLRLLMSYIYIWSAYS